MAISENSKNVFKYIQSAPNGVTLEDITKEFGLTPRQANGSVVSFQRRKDEDGTPLVVREEVTIEDADGVEKKIKLIKCTSAGMAFDPDAVPEKAAKAE